MNSIERAETVIKLRGQDIVGEFVILRPVTTKYAEEIVNLRNRPKNRYWFNQSEVVTCEEQIRWIQAYEKKTDDLYWCILDKKEHFVGTIRIYHIEVDGVQCEEGSYVVDENVAGEAPYAIEAKMLAIDTAFDSLDMLRMKNIVRVDNKVMNNMDNQLGFDKSGNVSVRGVKYDLRFLSKNDYKKNRHKFAEVVQYWSRRGDE